jgi:citrate synthase
MSRSSPITAIVAGGLAGDSTMYGAGTVQAIEIFIETALSQINEKNMSIEKFINNFAYKNGRLVAPGFARPLARGDERVPAMRRYAESLGYKAGKFETLANSIEAVLNERAGEGLNIAGYFTAFMKDQGYSIDEIMGIAALSVTTGIYAGYFEYIKQAPEAFLSLKVSDIQYTGQSIRKVPSRDNV